jgi:hypothetical protein
VIAPDGVEQETAETVWRNHVWFRPNALELHAMLGFDGAQRLDPRV